MLVTGHWWSYKGVLVAVVVVAALVVDSVEGVLPMSMVGINLDFTQKCY
jgi:hypothetical protein